MSEQEDAGIEHEELLTVSPSALEPDPIRPVGWRDIDEQLVNSVAEVGVVEFPLVRDTDDGLVVLDGTRRVQAAIEAGVEPIHVIRVSGGDEAALAAWVSTHTEPFIKSVSGDDEESALRALVGGSPSPVHDWEEDQDVEEAEYRLGLRTDADRIADATESVTGVGGAIAERLGDEFGNLEAVRNASAENLQEVAGVGDALAERLADWFDREENVRVEA